MTQSCCACSQCRAEIRRQILEVCHQQRRWLGPDTIRYYGLGWAPNGLYLEILEQMRAEGLILYSAGTPDDFPRYLAVKLMSRPNSMPIGREGGGHVA